MTRATRRRTEREEKKKREKEARHAKEQSSKGRMGYACPVCGSVFQTMEEVIDHQDETGHVYEV